jgi:hypothetical protein
MDRKAAKELAHIEGWLERDDEITQRGKAAYLADVLLQEAGDSLMMKLGEAANRLSRLSVLAPNTTTSSSTPPTEAPKSRAALGAPLTFSLAIR